jgi:hypothetical protein
MFVRVCVMQRRCEGFWGWAGIRSLGSRLILFLGFLEQIQTIALPDRAEDQGQLGLLFCSRVWGTVFSSKFLTWGCLTFTSDSVFIPHLLPWALCWLRFRAHNCFYVALIRHHDQGNLQKKFYFCLQFQNVGVHSSRDCTATDVRPGSRSKMLWAYTLNHIH